MASWLLIALVAVLAGLAIGVGTGRISLFKLGYSLYAHTDLSHWHHRRSLNTRKAKATQPHSAMKIVSIAGGALHVVVVPYLSDNYAYILVDGQTGEAAVVDGADPDAVDAGLAYATDKINLPHGVSVNFTTLLTTHGHADHSGGNVELKRRHPTITVYGSRRDFVSGATQELTHGQTVLLGSIVLSVFETPCHTVGSVIFHAQTPHNSPGAVFTGDTLFVAGCGKFFEGTATEMHRALYKTIATLPEETLMFPGHEYAASNLEFAAFVDSSNPAVADKLRLVQDLRRRKEAAVPTTLAAEKSYNPFMRCGQQKIQQFCHTTDAVEALAQLRKLKNAGAHNKAAKASHK